MATFRELKRRARKQLHAELSEPVLYFPERTDTPRAATVRLHLNFSLLGDLLATRVGYGETQETTPRIVFLLSECRPERDGYVITEHMGAYYIDNVQDPDDITITTMVSQVLPETALRYGWDPDLPWMGLPAPEAL